MISCTFIVLERCVNRLDLSAGLHGGVAAGRVLAKRLRSGLRPLRRPHRSGVARRPEWLATRVAAAEFDSWSHFCVEGRFESRDSRPRQSPTFGPWPASQGNRRGRPRGACLLEARNGRSGGTARCSSFAPRGLVVFSSLTSAAAGETLRSRTPFRLSDLVLQKYPPPKRLQGADRDALVSRFRRRQLDAHGRRNRK